MIMAGIVVFLVLVHLIAHLHGVEPAFREVLSLPYLVVSRLFTILLFAFFPTTLPLRGAYEPNPLVVRVVPGCENARRMQVFQGREEAEPLSASLPGDASQVLHTPVPAGHDEYVELSEIPLLTCALSTEVPVRSHLSPHPRVRLGTHVHLDEERSEGLVRPHQLHVAIWPDGYRATALAVVSPHLPPPQFRLTLPETDAESRAAQRCCEGRPKPRDGHRVLHEEGRRPVVLRRPVHFSPINTQVDSYSIRTS